MNDWPFGDPDDGEDRDDFDDVDDVDDVRYVTYVQHSEEYTIGQMMARLLIGGVVFLTVPFACQWLWSFLRFVVPWH